jgi:CxxC motif-containing protein (DUF1111 family)
MLRLSPTGQRSVVGLGFLGLTAVAVYWNFFTDGVPILWGPSARAAEVAEGRELFEHEWAPNDPLAHGDGLGPVFNAKSCATCHFQGGLGGGGGLEHNAVGFEVFPRRDDPTFITGGIHNFSTDPAFQESEAKLRQLYPAVKGRTIQSGSPGCTTTTTIPDFDPVRTESVQTTALFGAGWVDLISDRAILRNARNRGVRNATNELQFDFNNVPVGRVRHVRGGVGKFGWKALSATLEEFVAAACANELGLGTPYTEQAKPLGANTSSAPDLDKKQFRALVGFVKTLPKPVEVAAGPDTAGGKLLFASVGCAVCHVPDLGGVKGVYSDFLLYSLDDPPPPGSRAGDYNTGPSPLLGLPERPEHEPKPSEWKTPALWGVADSAPYLHDGSAATLQDAILRHGGDAKRVRERYNALSPGEKAALVAFLGTLKAPPTAPQLRDPSITKMARK